MNDILYRAAAYLLIIALGVFLKKVGFFHEQDFRTLAKILLNCMNTIFLGAQEKILT